MTPRNSPLPVACGVLFRISNVQRIPNFVIKLKLYISWRQKKSHQGISLFQPKRFPNNGTFQAEKFILGTIFRFFSENFSHFYCTSLFVRNCCCSLFFVLGFFIFLDFSFPNVYVVCPVRVWLRLKIMGERKTKIRTINVLHCESIFMKATRLNLQRRTRLLGRQVSVKSTDTA